MRDSPVRYLLYSHDTYGLGHFRRSATIASGIVAASPQAQVLIATGAPQAQAFSLPDRVDSLKLPSATKDSEGRYRSRRMTVDVSDLIALRAALLRAAAIHFEPDVIIVDQAPVGMGGELVPLLEATGGWRPRLVLGLRDIIDEASTVDDQWTADGAWPWIERYDDVLVYGDRRVLTTAVELDLGVRTDVPVTHTGYVAPAMPDPVPVDPFVLVTTGGGGDGHRLLRTYLDAIDDGAANGVRSVIVTGPLMSASRRAELVVRAERTPNVDVVEFSDNLRQLITTARGVVSMAGYNTVVEELAAGTPSLLVPRVHPRREQELRARRLAPHSELEHCPIEQLSPDRIANFISRLQADRPTLAATGHPTDIDLRGVERVASLLNHSHHRTKASADV